MKNAITASNVLGAEEYKKSVRDVLEFTGRTVCRTLGPCANTSIIEEMGPMVSSKDGFHTLKRILFAAEDTFATNVLTVITKMSHRMVSLVGDGSTTAVVAAWKFSIALALSTLQDARPRALNELVQKTLEQICEHIESRSVRPTAEELPAIMYKTALVSSNGDEKFAAMIQKIYEDTNNEVMFNLVQDDRSGKEETTFDIVNGYKAKQYYMLDPVFHNFKNGFEGKDVHVICFDMGLTQYHYNMIQVMAGLAHSSNPGEDPQYPQEVVVVAPSYDQNLMDKIAKDARADLAYINSKQLRHFRIRYARCLSVDQYHRNEFMDFCMMVGSIPISPVDFNEMVDPMSGREEYNNERLLEAIGNVGYMKTYLNDYMIVRGFPKRNEELFKTTFDHLKNIYDQMVIENTNSPFPSHAFAMTRRRFRKLLCRMVDINIGAPNEYERSLRFDAADDATKACESVATNGYNVGGNMAILFAIADLMKNDPNDAGHESRIEILRVLSNTFIAVLSEVFANKYTSEGYDSLSDEIKDEIHLIICNCIAKRTYYDMITDEYTDVIINSSRTDTEILRGALSISMTLLTANQYIMQIPTNRISQ